MCKTNCLKLKHRSPLSPHFVKTWYKRELIPIGAWNRCNPSSQCATVVGNASMVSGLSSWDIIILVFMIVTGSLETQIELLHKHLAKYTAHSNADWRQKSVTGAIWEKDYLRRKNKLKKALYGNGNAASEEQRKAYELLFGSEEFKARNVCLVGIPASGKTWISKKLSKL